MYAHRGRLADGCIKVVLLSLLMLQMTWRLHPISSHTSLQQNGYWTMIQPFGACLHGTTMERKAMCRGVVSVHVEVEGSPTSC